jgi:hypothetical protein
VGVDVDGARQDEQPARVDDLEIPIAGEASEVRLDRGDRLATNEDVGQSRAPGGDDRPTADE